MGRRAQLPWGWQGHNGTVSSTQHLVPPRGATCASTGAPTQPRYAPHGDSSPPELLLRGVLGSAPHHRCTTAPARRVLPSLPPLMPGCERQQVGCFASHHLPRCTTTAAPPDPALWRLLPGCPSPRTLGWVFLARAETAVPQPAALPAAPEGQGTAHHHGPVQHQHQSRLSPPGCRGHVSVQRWH